MSFIIRDGMVVCRSCGAVVAVGPRQCNDWRRRAAHICFSGEETP